MLSCSTNGPVVRATSPCGGRSSLITSAPRSDSTIDAYGPDKTQVRSNTFTPSSAPLMVAPLTGSPLARESPPQSNRVPGRNRSPPFVVVHPAGFVFDPTL